MLWFLVGCSGTPHVGDALAPPTAEQAPTAEPTAATPPPFERVFHPLGPAEILVDAADPLAHTLACVSAHTAAWDLHVLNETGRSLVATDVCGLGASGLEFRGMILDYECMTTGVDTWLAHLARDGVVVLRWEAVVTARPPWNGKVVVMSDEP
jgi:hypothetical protein